MLKRRHDAFLTTMTEDDVRRQIADQVEQRLGGHDAVRSMIAEEIRKSRFTDGSDAADLLLPGDHACVRFDGQLRSGIVLMIFDNGEHGRWCRIWCPGQDDHPEREWRSSTEIDAPLADFERIPGPRER